MKVPDLVFPDVPHEKPMLVNLEFQRNSGPNLGPLPDAPIYLYVENIISQVNKFSFDHDSFAYISR